MPATNKYWSKPPDSLELIPESVYVWLFPLDHAPAILNRMEQALSHDEKQKASRFLKKNNRDHYIAAHGILRVLLGLTIEIAPEKLIFNLDANGKPMLDARTTTKSVHFNLSHSHEHGLLAIASDRSVGVDLEHAKKQVDILKIAKRFFTTAEYETLQETPEHLQNETFFTGWCKKEALLKALGTGISGGLNRFQVSMETNAQPEIIQLPDQSSSLWRIQPLPAVASYARAVAAEGDDWTLRCYSWEDSLMGRR